MEINEGYMDKRLEAASIKSLLVTGFAAASMVMTMVVCGCMWFICFCQKDGFKDLMEESDDGITGY